MAKRKIKVNKEPAPRSIKRAFPQVKFVIDAKKSIAVHVRKSDCTNAIQLDPSECALARAAKREYQADAAVIGLSTSYIIKGDTAIRYESGERIAREIVSFDRHADFSPGDYQLTPKAPSTRFGFKKKESGPGGPNSGKTVETRKVHYTPKVRDLLNLARREEEKAND
jgi:hypothetical protein